MKYAILNDTHCGVRNSSDIFLDYQSKFYNEIFFPYLKEHNITEVLHLGDYFDNRTSVNIKAFKRNQEDFVKKLELYGITLWLMAGNHDQFYKNESETSSLQLLSYHDNINLLPMERCIEFANGFIMIPWINASNEERIMREIEETECEYAFMHAEFNGFPFMKNGQICTHGMSIEPFKKFKRVMSGHYHTKSEKGNIQYLGSQMEFSWSDFDDQKYFHVFDSETGELEAIPNPLKIHHLITLTSDNDIKYIDYSLCKDKFVKVILKHDISIANRKKIIENIKDAHEVKLINEFTVNHIDEELTSKMLNTVEFINKYVDGVDTLNEDVKENVKRLMIGKFNEISMGE